MWACLLPPSVFILITRTAYFNGSIFVTRAAARHLQGNNIILSGNHRCSFNLLELLQGTRFQDDITFMTDKFDKTTKLAFRDPSDPQYIKFGSVRDRDSYLGIRAGSLKLDGCVYTWLDEFEAESSLPLS